MRRSRQKRLCFLVQSHYSHTMGGAEYRCKLVIDQLMGNNSFEIYYACRNVDPNFVPNGYHIVKIGNRLSSYSIYFDMFGLLSALKKIHPHVIYQNGGSGDTGVAALYARKHGANLVHQICNDNTLRSFDGLRLKTRVKNWLNGFLLDYGMKNANTIIGQSTDQDRLLRERYGRKCDFIIPLGHPVPNCKIEKNPNIVKVLWISNFKCHQKQPEIFVKLAKHFLSCKNVNFIMIGGSVGRKSELNQLLSKIKTVPNLQYLGKKSQEEVNDQLLEGHILVNTSRYEGFPNTFVQAWMRGVPVVSLNVDPNDLIKNERIGFNSRSFEQLIKDVSILISNRMLRDEFGKQAREYALKNHNSDVMLREIIKILK